MTEKETIRNKVQEIRKDREITQEALADAVGVTRQTIISIERGNYIPSVLLAIKIADFFDKKVTDVFKIKKI